MLTQSERYIKKIAAIKDRDYLLAHTDTAEGVKYYVPNDEGLYVIAVHDEAQLAAVTAFYETDDFAYPDSDYAFVLHDGELKPRFETQ